MQRNKGLGWKGTDDVESVPRELDLVVVCNMWRSSHSSQLTGKELGDFVCFCGGCAGRVGRMVDGFWKI